MLFLQALHPHYKAIIDLFVSKQKDISITTINSIVSDAKYMDELAFLALTANLVLPQIVRPTSKTYLSDGAICQISSDFRQSYDAPKVTIRHKMSYS